MNVKKSSINLILIAAVLFTFSACKNAGYKTTETDETTEHELKAETEKDCSEVHWTHKDDSHGPENWKDLCPGYADCGGNAQSPINIVSANTKKEDKLTNFEIKYTTSPTRIINNGHTVQFNIEGNNKLILGDKEYDLLQFHYHAHSEHAIDGEYYPLEVHFVHKYADNDLAVIGIMISEGKEYNVFNKNIDSLPDVGGAYSPDYTLDLTHLNGEKPAYFYYKGSLTTPPCSEIVNWIVLKNPIEASKEQIATLSEILHNNYRPEMPLNERTVYEFGE